jgi:hypothetical protein
MADVGAPQEGDRDHEGAAPARPGALRAAAGRVLAPLLSRRRQLRRIEASLAQVHEELGIVHLGLRDDIGQASTTLRDDLGRVHADLLDAADDVRMSTALLRHVYEAQPESRRRVAAARRGESYELAFTEAEPLVSFVVPTYDSHESLLERALPSILGQGYENLEVIIVGDGSPPEASAAIRSVTDKRVRFYERTVRGPYPGDPSKRWFVVGSPPYDDGLALARGRWLACLDDDDAVRPDHTELLLRAATSNHFEHCYGRQLVHFDEGDPVEVGAFPPRIGEYGLQASIYHEAYRFFGTIPIDAEFREPNDWSLCRRMLEAGVRFGMVDAVVVDKHERRRRSAAEWLDGVPPRVD